MAWQHNPGQGCYPQIVGQGIPTEVNKASENISNNVIEEDIKEESEPIHLFAPVSGGLVQVVAKSNNVTPLSLDQMQELSNKQPLVNKAKSRTKSQITTNESEETENSSTFTPLE